MADIGIIGGADGPTAIFVTSSFGTGWLLLGFIAQAAAAAYLILRRRKK